MSVSHAAITRTSAIHWPAGHEPAGAAIHAANASTSRATPHEVWSWLVRPDRWADYYDNVSRVRHLAGPWPEIALGSRFSWTTFHAKVTTEVTECEPFERLAWTGEGLGSRGHHAWLLTSRPDGGTDIRTEETQRGAVSSLLRPMLRPNMRRAHQRWVDELARVAAA